MSHLVVQTSFLGDTVLTTPLLAELARRAPTDVLVTPASAPLLANNPSVREVLVYDKRGQDRGLTGFVRLVRKLRARRYQAAYLAQGSLRSGALTFASAIPRRVGFETSAGRRFYTECVAYADNEHHALRLLRLGLPYHASPTQAQWRPKLYPGARERTDVDALLGDAGWTSVPYVVFAPGSIWGTKRWPFYTELAKLLDDVRIVVVGAAADAELARALVAAIPDRALDATGRLSLLASAELIRRARALVTNDSAPLHLASAVDTPTVAIFGPTVPEFGFGPLAQQREIAGHTDLACRPCDRHGPQRCPLGHWRCMREITPAQIAAPLQRVMVAQPPSSTPSPSSTSPIS
jgi:heptosyltransferase-2